MKKFTKPLIWASLLLIGYFSATPLADAFTNCGNWNSQVVFMGIPMPGAATRHCTVTMECDYSADWNGTSWTVNSPSCN